jgi:glycerophosphoryl diester phosphodiesterase
MDKRPTPRNMDIKFGMWNVRSLYRAGSLRTAVKEISKYKDLVGVHKVRWDRGDTESAGECILSYGKGNENHESGTVFLYLREWH